jgi:hypothetical protein
LTPLLASTIIRALKKPGAAYFTRRAGEIA